MNIYDFEVKTIDGEKKTLAEYRGKMLLIVNVASKCGFTPQYAGLEALYRKNKDKGFVVLGFPCDQFAHQEPGSEAEIKSFCSLKYGVTFPMFSKISVNGKETHPLYKFLKHERPGVLGSKAIKWNFTKFLVGRDGAVLSRHSPNETPEKLEEELLPFLA
ncbi:MAG: glutathione peroxidase [Lentisphaerae bacterium GWF2_52_8]|nr:MAG: glutathione peroxidase [Lentisphaerae bacterium GWF2_52_8]